MSRTERDITHYLDRWKVKYVEVDTVVFENGRWRIIEGDGWRNRSRSSGGFDAMSGGVSHHTASPVGTSIESALGYELVTADAKPIGNFTLDRDATLYLTTGGASNTNGTGGPWLTNREVVPADTGNSRLVAIEAMNDGTGEEWPEPMLDAYILAWCAIADWATNETPGGPFFGVGKTIMAHFEWGNVQIPNRKNDPAGPKRYAGPGPTRWDMDRFRGDIFARYMAGPEPAPEPPPSVPDIPMEEDMPYRVAKLQNPDGSVGAFYIGNGNRSQTVGQGGDISMDESLLRMAAGAVNTIRVINDNATDAEAGPAIVTDWSQVKWTMKKINLRRYVGNHPNLV